jgi:hypothetical protein
MYRKWPSRYEPTATDPHWYDGLGEPVALLLFIALIAFIVLAVGLGVVQL